MAKKFTSISLLVILLLTSCAGSTPTFSPASGQGSSVVTPLPVATATLTPAPSDTPSVSQDELREKWQPALVGYVLASSVCETSIETINNRINGETSDAKLTGEILGIQIVIGIVNRAMEEWSPTTEQQPYKDNIQARMNNISTLVELWSNGDWTDDQVAADMKKECDTIQAETEDIVLSARNQGITQETLDAIVQDLQESMTASAPAEQSQEEAAAPTEPGMSRANPFPAGQVASAPNWDIQVKEIRRGAEAWQMVQAANPYNEPPPEGMEYVLANVWVKNTSSADNPLAISSSDFQLTGANAVQYSGVSIVEPEPSLDATLYPGGEAEGWVGLLAAADEGGLILVFDEMLNWEEDTVRFIALDEGVSYTVPEELRMITPTDVGAARNSPAAPGESVVTPDWQVEVVEVIRGSEAWSLIQAANSYNEPPASGMEYVLAKVRVRYIGSSYLAESIDDSFFHVTGSQNVVYDYPSVVSPAPGMDFHLFPGGSGEGWVPLVVQEGETGLILIFEPLFDFDGQSKRFLSLEP